MKKLWLICQKSDRDDTLDELARLGVLHITPTVAPENEALDATAQEAAAVEHALRILPSDVPEEAPGIDHSLSPKAVMHRIETYLVDRQLTEGHIAELRSEIERIEQFGDFDPEQIASLAEAGVTVKLVRYDAHGKTELPDGVQRHILLEEKNATYAALVATAPFEVEGEVVPPEQSLTTLRRHLQECLARLAHISQHLSYMAGYRPMLLEYLATVRSQHDMLSVSAGMGDTSHLVYLQGYCPVDDVQAVKAEAIRSGWGVVVRDPGPDDPVPTLIRNPAWVRPINCVFSMLDILPGYHEVDIRSVFLIFFALFFAVLVGDAGYGAIFLVMAVLARIKMKQAPREPFRLAIFLSLCTIVWGAITGNYFGILQLPAPLRGFEIPWMKDEHNLMAFSFLVGAIHLTVAHLWVAFRQRRSTRALAQVGWIGLTWFMYFLASNMILGSEFPAWAMGLFWSCLALLILFMTPITQLKEEWSDHIMLPFDVIGNFADLVSYVRLFAVGSAGLAVAIAFNELAIGSGVEGVGATIKASIILFLGHALNIILCLMSILVHGVRLNTLEFSGHIGLEWAGFKYEPFTIRRATEQNA